MAPWHEWARLVQRALVHPEPVTLRDVLLVRDPSGQIARAFEPAPGVVPRVAGALLLLYPQDADLRFPLTVRSHALPLHRGEVSLPGGGADPDDDDVQQTALRECYEELGVPPEHVTIWGSLSRFYIQHSNFYLTPVVGFSASVPEWRPNPNEVAELLTLSVRELLDPDLVREEDWALGDRMLVRPYFAVAGHKVWGATAVVLSELAVRLRRAQADDAAGAAAKEEHRDT